MAVGHAAFEGVFNLPLEVPIASQVEPMSTQHQGGLARAIVHQVGALQFATPRGHRPSAQDIVRLGDRWQRRGLVSIEGDGQRLSRLRQGAAQIQADMTASELMTGQCCRQQNNTGVIRHFLVQKAHQGHVQLAQPTANHPLVQQRDQAQGAIQRVCHDTSPEWPANKRSSSSIKALGGRSKCTPAVGAVMPRT